MPNDDGAVASVTMADIRRLLDVLENARAKASGTWISRHQHIAIAVASAAITMVVAIGSWGITTWTREQVLKIQVPIDESQNEAIAEEITTRQAVTDVLQQNDEDFARYAEEADRYERQVLNSVAKKLGIQTPSRAELDRATQRLRGIRERRRQ